MRNKKRNRFWFDFNRSTRRPVKSLFKPSKGKSALKADKEKVHGPVTLTDMKMRKKHISMEDFRKITEYLDDDELKIMFKDCDSKRRTMTSYFGHNNVIFGRDDVIRSFYNH